LLGEGSVGSGAIEAYTEDFRVGGIDLAGGESSLDRLKLFRSTFSEGQNVNGQQDILLSAIVAEFDGFPLVAEQGEVRSNVANLERYLGERRFFRLRRRARQRGGNT